MIDCFSSFSRMNPKKRYGKRPRVAVLMEGCPIDIPSGPEVKTGKRRQPVLLMEKLPPDLRERIEVTAQRHPIKTMGLGAVEPKTPTTDDKSPQCAKNDTSEERKDVFDFCRELGLNYGDLFGDE